MTKATRIQDCLDHHEEYVLALAAMPDRRLREKLDTIHLQMALAEQQRNTAAIELLEVWRAQAIEARTYKAENNIADAPDEIAGAIADIQTYPAPEAGEMPAVKDEPARQARKPISANDKNEQLSFF
jgi:hypothetical protein